MFGHVLALFLSFFLIYIRVYMATFKQFAQLSSCVPLRNIESYVATRYIIAPS